MPGIVPTGNRCRERAGQACACARSRRGVAALAGLRGRGQNARRTCRREGACVRRVARRTSPVDRKTKLAPKLHARPPGWMDVDLMRKRILRGLAGLCAAVALYVAAPWAGAALKAVEVPPEAEDKPAAA